MKIRKYLPIIGILIFLYILIKLDISNILEEILNARINYIILAFLFVFVFLIIQTSKWFVIAKVQHIKVPFTDAFKINLISFFYGFITPSRLGVAIRADYLKNYPNGSLGKGLSNYTLDKVLDICSLIFIVIISIIFIRSIPVKYFYYFIISFVVLVGGLMMFIDKERSKRLLKRFYRIVPKKLKEKAKTGFDSFYQDMPKKRFFVLFFVLNVINWIVLYTLTFLMGLSVGIDAPYVYYLAILPVATIISQIPITIGGLGTREVTMISLFGLIGVEATKVVSMSVIGMVISGIIPAIIGGFLIFKKRKR